MALRDQIRHPSLPVASAGALVATVLLAAATLVASGNSRAVAHLLTGGTWVPNSAAGSVSHLGPGGVDADVHLRAPMAGGLKVVQDGGHIYVVDASGHLARIDQAQLSVAQQVDLSASGVQIVAGGGRLYAVDAGRGVVVELDPLSLVPTGPSVQLDGPLGTAIVDASGTLWVPETASGAVVSVSGGSQRDHIQVGAPGAAVTLSVVGPDVVALDAADATVQTLAGPDAGSSWTVPLAAGTAMTMPAAVESGVIVPVLAPGQGELATLGIGGGSRFQVDLGAAGDNLGTPQINGNDVYIPDYSTGQLLVVDDTDGQLLARITITGHAGYFDMSVENGELFVNDADTNQAWVIDGSGGVQPVTKYSTTDPTPSPPKATVPPPPPITPAAPPPAPTPGQPAPPPTVVVPGPGGSLAQGAPTDVVATAGEQTATVTWHAPFGDVSTTGFQVTLSPGGATANVGAGQTSYTATGLTDGQLYFFTIVATTGKGPSAPAISNTVRPGAAAVPPPTSVVATAASPSSITISWTAPANPPSRITGYSVADSVDGTSKSVTAPSTTVTFDGLAPGTVYRFAVVALSGDGTTSNPAASNAVTLNGAPSAPTDVVASAAGSGRINVSWTAPPDNGSAITGYAVTVEPGDVKETVSQPTATTTAIQGLTNGDTYKVTVTATNAIGTGPASGSSTVRVSAQVPPAATGVTAAVGGDAATVTWSAGADNGDAPTGYRVTNLTDGSDQKVTGTSARFAGLTPGTSYSFSVVAIDGSGNAGPAAQSAAVMPSAPPSAPAISSVQAAQAGELVVNFGAPAQLNGSTITGYTATAAPGGAVASGGGSPLTLTGLAAGTSYTITVVAHSTAGDSPASAPAAGSTAGVPGAPTITAASATSVRGSVTFTAPASPGGAAITGYTVDPGDGNSTISLPAGTTTASWDTSGDSGSYSVSVTATNAIGTGPAAGHAYTVKPLKTGPSGPCGANTDAARGDAVPLILPAPCNQL